MRGPERRRYRVRRCDTCQQRRRVWRVRHLSGVPDEEWTCSRGHTWIVRGLTLERVAAAQREILLPRLADLFAPSPLLQVLRR